MDSTFNKDIDSLIELRNRLNGDDRDTMTLFIERYKWALAVITVMREGIAALREELDGKE